MGLTQDLWQLQLRPLCGNTVSRGNTPIRLISPDVIKSVMNISPKNKGSLSMMHGDINYEDTQELV